MEDSSVFNWKSILKGLAVALIICGLTFLVIVVLFPSWYGEARYFYWGNALVFITFMAVVAAFFVDRGANRRIQKETKDRYTRIPWDHPQKIKYYTATRILYWIGIWGSILYLILYALGWVKLDIDSIAGFVFL